MVGDSGRKNKSSSARGTAKKTSNPRAFAAVVGESIRRARHGHGWTQVELADAADLSPNYIARLERGELGPSLLVATQICSALGIELGALLVAPPAQKRSAKRK
jgi:transcriptional regulator with XRE-family HTH domain